MWTFERMKRALLILLGLLLAFFAFLAWYKATNSMDVVSERSSGPEEAAQRVLVATQGSTYKDLVTDHVIGHLTDQSIAVQVVDVTMLGSVDASPFDAVVILHTWENWEPQPDAQAFLNAHPDRTRFVVLATSGGGDEMIEGVDGISSASVMDEAQADADNLIARLDRVLARGRAPVSPSSR